MKKLSRYYKKIKDISKNQLKDYSFAITFKKTFVRFVIIIIPILLQILPDDFLNITLGALLLGVYDFAKHGTGLRKFLA
jgi:hypothetical protein